MWREWCSHLRPLGKVGFICANDFKRFTLCKRRRSRACVWVSVFVWICPLSGSSRFWKHKLKKLLVLSPCQGVDWQHRQRESGKTGHPFSSPRSCLYNYEIVFKCALDWGWQLKWLLAPQGSDASRLKLWDCKRRILKFSVIPSISLFLSSKMKWNTTLKRMKQRPVSPGQSSPGGLQPSEFSNYPIRLITAFPSHSSGQKLVPRDE